MLIVPLQPVPHQIVQCVLGTQRVQMDIRTRRYGLYVDVYANNVAIVWGVLAENINRLVRDAYLGFVGDLMFLDTQGTSDPLYSGFGSRWLLCYLTPAESAQLGTGQ